MYTLHSEYKEDFVVTNVQSSFDEGFHSSLSTNSQGCSVVLFNINMPLFAIILFSISFCLDVLGLILLLLKTFES